MEKTEENLSDTLSSSLVLSTTNKIESDSDEIYTDKEDQQQNCSDLTENMTMPLHSPQQGILTDSQGLIVPKKIINPCIDSPDRQNLHRELKFNQKIGKNVLNQKTELQRALERQKERKTLLQHQEETESNLKGELSRVIMERAQRIEKKSIDNDEINNQLNPEYLIARAKLRTIVDLK